MAAAVDAKLTVGDRQRAIRATLRNADGTLATLTAVSFLMVHQLGTVKTNYAACVIESPGLVRYDLQATDVNTAGIYHIWFRDTNGSGLTQHWPDRGPVYALEFVTPA